MVLRKTRTETIIKIWFIEIITIKNMGVIVKLKITFTMHKDFWGINTN